MEKCADKNARFYFKLSITQIRELGSTRKSIKMSFKEFMKSGSFRGSMKDLTMSSSFKDSFKQSFRGHDLEESKLEGKDTRDNEDIEELYR